MSLFQWPFKRKQYPGINNPRFVGDVVASNEAVLDGLMYLTGLSATDFAIIWGLEHILPADTYNPGVIYLNGNFYYVRGTFAANLYLAPQTEDTMIQPFGDGTPRKIYQLLYAIPSAGSTPTTSPIFTGEMNQYRLGLKTLNSNIQAILTTLSLLKGAAFQNVGVTAGTVAAGDDARFGYTKTDIDNLFAKKVDVIIKNGGTAYTPIQATDPANKGYVDGTSALRMISGTIHIGDVPPGGTLTTIPFGITLGDANYIVLWSLLSAKSDPQTDVLYCPNIRAKTTVGFDVYFREGGANVEDISFDWIVFHK